MLPSWRTLDLIPGAVLRRAHVDHIKAVIARLRGGLRGETDIPITGYVSARSGVTFSVITGGSTFTAAGDELHIALPLRVGDRITHWQLSLERAGAAGLSVELRRFRMDAPGYEVPALHTQTSLPSLLTTRQVMPANGLRAVTVEDGYCYRLVIIAGNANDVTYGGSVRIDHPRAG